MISAIWDDLIKLRFAIEFQDPRLLRDDSSVANSPTENGDLTTHFYPLAVLPPRYGRLGAAMGTD
ncbi:MAG: hypothetical protein ACFB0G_16555 [Leptolyngbyaceae cyanobacterium]